MQITFIYYYFIVCSKCGTKIAEVTPGNNGTNNQHYYNTQNYSGTCPNCGEAKEFNVIKAETKTFKD